ncbi:MAG: phosphatase PAP2 family protein [Chthoniobacterales bacterium]|nr:phosphatase PAP2 family protein [Chthoniobacterales bacterium]
MERICLKKTALLLLVMSGMLLLIRASFFLDAPVRAAIVQMEGSNWDQSSQKSIVGCISRYGDWPELMGLGLLGFFIARKRGNSKWQRLFLIAMVASTLAGTLVNTMRLTTGRTRPRVSPAATQGWYGPYANRAWYIGKSEYNSFPSGHTATAIAFATIIFFGSPCWGILSLLLAVAIASSRVLLGAHHPSDVVAAILIAFTVAWLVWKYHDRVPGRYWERLLGRGSGVVE